jgi:hypothetical protein
MKAARMMMKTAMKVAERMRYSKPVRGAQLPARHGPLQRLLEVTHRSPLCACGATAASEGTVLEC